MNSCIPPPPIIPKREICGSPNTFMPIAWAASASRSSSKPDAASVPTAAPTLAPTMRSGSSPAARSSRMTPTCAKPRMAPLDRTSAHLTGAAGATNRGSSPGAIGCSRETGRRVQLADSNAATGRRTEAKSNRASGIGYFSFGSSRRLGLAHRTSADQKKDGRNDEHR